MSEIHEVHARRIYDSCGIPAVEVEVVLKSGITGTASCPAVQQISGNDVSAVLNSISPELEGLDVIDQPVIDRAVTEAAGNVDCSVTFSVSLACARAAAEFQELPLFRYLGGVLSCRIPECIYCVKEQFFRFAETGTFSGDFKQAMAALSAGDEADLRPISDLPGTAVIPAECGTVSAALKTAEKIHRSGRTVLFRQIDSTGDDGLADLAVAANAAFLLPGQEAQIIVGNRLLRIGEMLGDQAEYGA